MVIPMSHQNQFLGRHFDLKTLTWVFNDNSSPPIPDEMRIDVLDVLNDSPRNGLSVLSVIFNWHAILNRKK